MLFEYNEFRFLLSDPLHPGVSESGWEVADRSAIKLASEVRASLTVSIPPVPIIGGQRHAVLPLTSVRLAGQKLLVPLEEGDSDPVFKEVEPFRAAVRDTDPQRPVTRVEELSRVFGQGC